MSLRQKNPIVASMFHQLPTPLDQTFAADSSAASCRCASAMPAPATNCPSCKPAHSIPARPGWSGNDDNSFASSSPFCSRQVFEIFPMLRWLSTKRMTTPVTAVNLTTGDTSATGTSQLDKRLFLILAAIALIYAFLAGLRTVSEFRSEEHTS